MVDKIFHVGDIHIRNYKRHSEYRSVFNRLFQYIQENVTPNSIIYLAGDIVHSKNDMSPELIQLTTEFLKGCCNITDTILITGNHDLNLNNESRLDALTPIVDAILHPKLHYLKDSGVYEINGIAFSVFSVLGDTDNWVKANSIESRYKVALHHGAVSSAITDLNYTITNDLTTPQMFKGFDLVLLGDIHKTQYLNSEQTIAYCGSLIQQNHGEDLDHGLLVWDVQSKTSEFVKIDNDIAYVTINVHNGKVTDSKEYVQKFPKHLRLRIKHSHTTYKQLNEIIQLFKSRYSIDELNVMRTNDSELVHNSSSTVLGDVRDVEYQNQLFEQFIKDNQLDSINIDGIRHINRISNTKLDPTMTYVRNAIWKPIRFEFSNMFSYGPNNVVDFTQFTNVQGLFAPNASGKSTLLDAITYCLFDKCSRTYRAKDVMNVNSTTFKCKLVFELNHMVYVIERDAKTDPRTGNVKVNVSFYQDLNGSVITLNGVDRDNTNKIIRGYIGSYDDFLLTAISTQNDNKNFIFKTQRERKDLLNSFLDISIFDELYVIAKNNIKEKQALLKNLESENILVTIQTIQPELEKLNTEYSKIQILGSDTEVELTTCFENITKLSKSLHQVPELIDIDKISEELNSYTSEYNVFNSKISELQLELEQVTFNLTQLQKNKSNDINIVQLKENIQSQRSIEESLSNTLLVCKSEHTHVLEQVNNLKLHEYDPNCTYCVNNSFVKTAMDCKLRLPILETEIQNLELQLQENKSILDLLTVQYDEMYKIESEINNLNASCNKISKDINLYTVKRDFSLQSIDLLKEKIKLYQDQKDAQDHNLKVTDKINELQQKYELIKLKHKQTQSTLLELTGKISSYTTKLDQYNEKMTQMLNLQEEVGLYETYMSMVSKGGIPHLLLKKIVPVIQDELNNIIAGIVDFQVSLDVDDKNINCYIHYSDEMTWPVELASGMERFIISIAMRVALINISSLPRPNFIAIDEGFGVLDSDNLSSIQLLFEYLKNQFNFIMVISHLDVMRDYVDNLITIDRSKRGHSLINIV